MTENDIVLLIILITIVTVIIGLALTPLKMKYRDKKLNRLRKCLEPKNSKLILDRNDLGLLHHYLPKYQKYSEK